MLSDACVNLAFGGRENQEEISVTLPAVKKQKGNPPGHEILDLGDTAFDVVNLKRVRIKGAGRRPKRFGITKKK